jgi:putative phosphoribosyl transferase
MAYLFRNRRDAGRKLAPVLHAYAERDAVVLALPRGGVPVGFEVSLALHIPLDVLIVRKLGVPGQEELAMGAMASGGIRVLDDQVMRLLCLSNLQIEQVTQHEHQELLRREHLYRGDPKGLSVEHKVVIIVDDGLATGSTMRAAVLTVRQRQPSKVIVAVPVAPIETCNELKLEADEVICLMTPPVFSGVGKWYEDFSQTSDEEVQALLDAAMENAHRP